MAASALADTVMLEGGEKLRGKAAQGSRLRAQGSGKIVECIVEDLA
jgi:hypothetical protein